jgi:Serpin (serine protease inhibitor)
MSIHEEFGFLLDDLTQNSANPSRFRPKVPWRSNASADYERRAMKFQSNQPSYDEHKITGRLSDSWANAFVREISRHFLIFRFSFTVANGIFVQRDFSIRDEYKNVVESVYRSEIRSLDFRREPQQAAKIINE